MPIPRFTLVIEGPLQGPQGLGLFRHKERMVNFFSLQGLEQWLANARATGEVGEQDKVSVYDDSGCKL